MENRVRNLSGGLLATKIFNSFVQNKRPWALSRTLLSDNHLELQGELNGVAFFQHNQNGDLVYEEMGDMSGVAKNMTGMKWSRKYIWKMGSKPECQHASDLSVWFAKVSQTNSKEPGPGGYNDTPEADYLFHKLEFLSEPVMIENNTENGVAQGLLVPPPVPDISTKVFLARGSHLCVNDMYATTYAFRVSDDDELDVKSWSTRHVVNGPKKSQHIVNMYQRTSGDDSLSQ
ncbi:hypothetical protein FQN57_005838 [Myotisia sp. PD_48]|nr:hypothetical protein FQN57_005838 [Myotisia sp. PD_48]